MLRACDKHAMKNLQAKNVPASLHQKAVALADRRGMSLSQLIVEALERELEREVFRQRLSKRASVKLKSSSRQALEDERAAR